MYKLHFDNSYLINEHDDDDDDDDVGYSFLSVFRCTSTASENHGPQIWSGWVTNINVPPKVSPCCMHLCIRYCAIMLLSFSPESYTESGPGYSSALGLGPRPKLCDG